MPSRDFSKNIKVAKCQFDRRKKVLIIHRKVGFAKTGSGNVVFLKCTALIWSRVAWLGRRSDRIFS